MWSCSSSPFSFKHHWLRITDVTCVIDLLMKLKRRKFTFPISRVWGAGLCAVIYNGGSRSQSCSGIVQTLGLMSCCWIRLLRKSVLQRAKRQRKYLHSSRGHPTHALFTHTQRGETAQTLRGVYQEYWRSANIENLGLKSSQQQLTRKEKKLWKMPFYSSLYTDYFHLKSLF